MKVYLDNSATTRVYPEAAELVLCAKKGGAFGKLALLETTLPPEEDKAIKQKLETIYSETANNKRALTSAEKRFIFCICHSGSYMRYKDTIDGILAADPDERLRKVKHILPLRGDLASPESVGQTSTATEPYALKYMFLRYSADSSSSDSQCPEAPARRLTRVP